MAITENELYNLLDRILFLNIAATLVLTVGTALLGVQYARTGDITVLAEMIISIALMPLLCLAVLLTHRVKTDSSPIKMMAPELISALSAMASGGIAITNGVHGIIRGEPSGGLPSFQLVMSVLFALSTGLGAALAWVSDKLRRSLSRESSSGEGGLISAPSRRSASEEYPRGPGLEYAQALHMP